jgi:TonB family protein
MQFLSAVRNASLAFAAASVAASAMAQTVPPTAAIQAEPAGKWSVEYGDWQCLLHRDLTAGGKPGYVSLSMEPLSATGWLKIAMPGGGGRSSGDDAVLFVDGQRVPGTIHYNAYREGPNRVREFMIDFKQHSLSKLNDRVRIWSKSGGDVEAGVTGFQPAWSALTKCMAEFYADLGVSTADLAQIAKPAGGEALSFVDLPVGPNQEMDLALFFWINARGGVEKCRLLKPSGKKAFDATVCSQLEAKARFQPATNAAGAAIPVPHYEHDRLATVTTTE